MSDDWSLTGEQILFLFQHNNLIEDAMDRDDLETIRQLAASNEFKFVFGEMGFDEAWDRYVSGLDI